MTTSTRPMLRSVPAPIVAATQLQLEAAGFAPEEACQIVGDAVRAVEGAIAGFVGALEPLDGHRWANATGTAFGLLSGVMKINRDRFVESLSRRGVRVEETVVSAGPGDFGDRA